MEVLLMGNDRQYIHTRSQSDVHRSVTYVHTYIRQTDGAGSTLITLRRSSNDLCETAQSNIKGD